MTTRSCLLVLGLVLFTLLPVGAPHAGAGRSACLDRALAGAMAQGWRSRGVDTESLLPGDSTRYEMSFYKGSRYLFLACTDDDDAGITLAVTDSAGKPLGKPSDKGANVLLEVKAVRAGGHVLELGLQSPSEGRPTWYALAMLYR
ncbi:MAG: hypothetical protein HY904_02975 [Deltaproteobacteria bacterium]|nr:hypothetical protein [Deltaproteobacteria bacterium]